MLALPEITLHPGSSTFPNQNFFLKIRPARQCTVLRPFTLIRMSELNRELQALYAEMRALHVDPKRFEDESGDELRLLRDPCVQQRDSRNVTLEARFRVMEERLSAIELRLERTNRESALQVDKSIFLFLTNFVIFPTSIFWLGIRNARRYTIPYYGRDAA
jgi:hypothetical protein